MNYEIIIKIFIRVDIASCLKVEFFLVLQTSSLPAKVTTSSATGKHVSKICVFCFPYKIRSGPGFSTGG